MKILVLQLARLGDIFQTWPTLHALERQGAEIHVLVRPKFCAATVGCSAIHRVHEFDTSAILSTVLDDSRRGLSPSLEALDSLLHRLDMEKYDRIINLSFSPLSSWITFELEMRAFAREMAIGTAGYTRHIDGTLAIPDDASAYFFAQVGYRAQSGSTESINRLSLPRLFATIASVDPEAEDWRGPTRSRLPFDLPEKFVAVHVGASDENKTLDADHWGEVAARIVRRLECPVVLLGSNAEIEKAEAIVASVERNGVVVSRASGSHSRILSLVGKTDLNEIFEVLHRSSLLVAGDSALVQMASLVGTRVLNLSSRHVSHWETGPGSQGSRIILYGGAAPATEAIICEIENMMFETAQKESDRSSLSAYISIADRKVAGPLEPIVENTSDGYADFTWKLISAIYLGTEVPVATDDRLQEILKQWCEVQSIENHQLHSLKMKNGNEAQIGSILERIDQVTGLLVEAEPRLGPIERWLSTERIRLGPQSYDNLIDNFLVLNERLESILLSLCQVEERHDGHQLDI